MQNASTKSFSIKNLIPIGILLIVLLIESFFMVLYVFNNIDNYRNHKDIRLLSATDLHPVRFDEIPEEKRQYLSSTGSYYTVTVEYANHGSSPEAIPYIKVAHLNLESIVSSTSDSYYYDTTTDETFHYKTMKIPGGTTMKSTIYFRLREEDVKETTELLIYNFSEIPKYANIKKEEQQHHILRIPFPQEK